MTRLGRQDGEPLVVDLRGRLIESPGQLWDALAGPCGLPAWFGRNLDAWRDTLYGGISAALDDHRLLVIKLSPQGLFAAGNEQGRAFIEETEATGYAQVQLTRDPADPVS